MKYLNFITEKKYGWLEISWNDNSENLEQCQLISDFYQCLEPVRTGDDYDVELPKYFSCSIKEKFQNVFNNWLKQKINTDIKTNLVKFKNFIFDTEENSLFYLFLSDSKFPDSEIQKCQSNISPTKTAEDKCIESCLGPLLEKYDYILVDGLNKQFLGENSNVCLFCGKKQGETDFTKVAHTISESLGNKNLFTKDECDKCNELFGQTIEKDLSTFLLLWRVFFGIRGKKGIPKMSGHGFELCNNQGKIKIKTQKDSFCRNGDTFQLKLNSTYKYSRYNIYRCLCKYAVSIIPRQYLPRLCQTINWILGKTEPDKLPKIAMATDVIPQSTNPSIAVYIRKDNDQDYPLFYAELRIMRIRFIYIIPTFDEPKDFTEDLDWKNFWEFLPYKAFSKFEFFNCSSKTRIKINNNLTFKRRKREG